MKKVFSRRSAILALTSVFGLCLAAWAADHEVIEFAYQTNVQIGSSISANVQVNEAPMQVTFTSSGNLVNYTTTVTSTSATVNVPTNPNASPGNYTITVTPTGGGVAKNGTVYASSIPLGFGSGNQ